MKYSVVIIREIIVTRLRGRRMIEIISRKRDDLSTGTMHNPPGTGTLKLRGDEYSEINELKKVFLLLLLFISRII